MSNEEHYKLLGKLCVTFQALEIHISLLTWSLINEDQLIGRIVTSKMSFSRICDTLIGLSKYRFGEDSDTTKTILDLISRSTQIEQDRNIYIHSYWTTDESSGEPGRFKPSFNRKKGLIESHEHKIDLEHLRKINKEAVLISDEFSKLITREFSALMLKLSQT